MIALAAAAAVAAASSSRPNFVVLFMDDNGWGDAGCNDKTTTETPNIDRMAAEGTRFVDFHVGFSVCTPSRAALLTGRLCPRTGVCNNFNEGSRYGMSADEITVADVLLESGYDTHMIGKWHLGHNPPYHPTYRGFQTFMGLPYSGDMGCLDSTPQGCRPGFNRSVGTPACPKFCPSDDAHTIEDVAIPLYNSTSLNCSGKPGREGCDSDIVEAPFNPFSLNERYATRAVEIIGNSAQSTKPFFLYVAFAHTHTPVAYASQWAGKSPRKGFYQTFGDMLFEVDNAIGVINDAISASPQAENILTLLTADNGPADLGIVDCDSIGSQGPYVGAWQKSAAGGGGGGTGKGTVWEGGHRVVGIAKWAGHVPARVSNALVSSLDFLPTLVALAGAKLPDRALDGMDITDLLLGKTDKAHTTLFHPQDAYTSGTDAERKNWVPAMRLGKYKGYWQTFGQKSCFLPNGTHRTGQGKRITHDPPLVFDVSSDPAESTPVDASTIPDVIAQMRQEYAKFWDSVLSEPMHKTNFSKDFDYRPCGNRTSACCRISS